jgi:glycosyltransferase involved in cell wall biosynthesis
MDKKRNIAIVVQRYGKEIHGGAETHCRLLAVELSKQHTITILTTVAKDYTTWQPFFKEGSSVEDNLKIIRFNNLPKAANAKLRFIRHKITNRLWYHYIIKAIGLHKWFSKKFDFYNPTQKDHIDWLTAQGPACPDLLEYIRSNKNEYDVFIFFSHLYYPTALGIQLVKEKSMLIPTVHDEKASYYPVYQSVMHAPKWVLYNSAVEKKVAEKIYGVQNKSNAIVGVGVQLPGLIPNPDYLKKYAIPGPYIIYVGRIEKGKGCKELIHFFKNFKLKNPGQLQLVMIGKAYMQLPDEKDIIFTGFIDDTDKFQLLLQSTLMVVPSRFESLSMVLLEAMFYKKPVLVNKNCTVLEEHIISSDGGLSYSSYDDFCIKLDTLLKSPSLMALKGNNGYDYVQSNYSWKIVLNKINTIIDDISGTT